MIFICAALLSTLSEETDIVNRHKDLRGQTTCLCSVEFPVFDPEKTTVGSQALTVSVLSVATSFLICFISVVSVSTFLSFSVIQALSKDLSFSASSQTFGIRFLSSFTTPAVTVASRRKF